MSLAFDELALSSAFISYLYYANHRVLGSDLLTMEYPYAEWCTAHQADRIPQTEVFCLSLGHSGRIYSGRCALVFVFRHVRRKTQHVRTVAEAV